MKTQLYKTVWLAALMLFTLLAVPGHSAAQTNESASLSIKGVALDAKGPLGNRVVMLLPIDTVEGKPVVRFSYGHSTLSLNSQRKSGSAPWEYFYSIVGEGSMLNPRGVTNAKGEFKLSVPAGFFKGYRPGEFALGAFFGTPANPTISRFETMPLKFDDKTTSLDAGRLAFKSVKEPSPQ